MASNSQPDLIETWLINCSVTQFEQLVKLLDIKPRGWHYGQ